jgi:hypothetical protein
MSLGCTLATVVMGLALSTIGAMLLSHLAYLSPLGPFEAWIAGFCGSLLVVAGTMLCRRRRDPTADPRLSATSDHYQLWSLFPLWLGVVVAGFAVFFNELAHVHSYPGPILLQIF